MHLACKLAVLNQAKGRFTLWCLGVRQRRAIPICFETCGHHPAAAVSALLAAHFIPTVRALCTQMRLHSHRLGIFYSKMRLLCIGIVLGQTAVLGQFSGQTVILGQRCTEGFRTNGPVCLSTAWKPCQDSLALSWWVQSQVTVVLCPLLYSSKCSSPLGVQLSLLDKDKWV
jgi:hypothetical protein